MSVSSNEESVDIDKIGQAKKIKEKKKPERTFLQKRKDAKEHFKQRMAKMQDDDRKVQRELDELTIKHNKDFGSLLP